VKARTVGSGVEKYGDWRKGREQGEPAMSLGEVLFQGTWHDAVSRAEQIPEAMQVQIVSAEASDEAVSPERFQAIARELIREAQEANASDDEEKQTMPDAYMLILQEKFRRQGFQFK
jgi:hypothetical protein